MSDSVIKVDNLSKRYLIRHQQRERYVTLRDSMTRGMKNFGRTLLSPFMGHHSPSTASKEEFYALRDVSFEIRPGERVGIIGRNGAGKSTLLKILSRITEPTSGRVELTGRVSSLLEVGTGFHPELTGRENIFLNGSILGMTKTEIRKKFDEIVEFAETQKFLDTPVKRYSSGMYVRLAFAVAAHLDPDIMLIDEVLAVGDAGFQKKCIASINRSAGEGRTALIVSHNMGLVRSLCSRAVLMERGRVICEGEPGEVISRYHTSANTTEAGYKAAPDRMKKTVFFSEAYIRSSRGDIVSEVPCGEGFSIEMKLKGKDGETIERPWVGVMIFSALGQLVTSLANREAGFELPPLSRESTICCDVEALNLTPGEYQISFGISDTNRKALDKVESGLSLTVTPADFFGSGMLPTSRNGQVVFQSRWRAGKGAVSNDS